MVIISERESKLLYDLAMLKRMRENYKRQPLSQQSVLSISRDIIRIETTLKEDFNG